MLPDQKIVTCGVNRPRSFNVSAIVSLQSVVLAVWSSVYDRDPEEYTLPYRGDNVIQTPSEPAARKIEVFAFPHTSFYPAHWETLSMTNRLVASIFILLMNIATARAADDIVGPLRTQWDFTRNLVVNLVQVMPEEKFDYKPTPEVRSFREIVKHLILENYNFMSMVAGTPAPDKAKFEALKSRDELTTALAESYAFGVRTLADLTDTKAVEKISMRGKPVVRWYPALYNIQDSMDHYGNLVVYVRLNGLVPPRTAAASKAKSR